MINRPLLSICIPTYNRCDIVCNCVNKCLKFSNDWIEVVVTDNCSNDDTVYKLSLIDDPRLKIYQNGENIGYVNFVQSIRNGTGKFCMILLDEDTIVDVDWESVKKQLLNSNDVVLFHTGCKNVNGDFIIKPFENSNDQKGENEKFLKIYNDYIYPAGMIFPKEVMDKCWLNNYEDIPLIWSLYCYKVIAMQCAEYGKLQRIDNIFIQQSKYTNKKKCNTKACFSEMNEPYWSINSCIVQLKEWMHFFSYLNIDKNVHIGLAENILCDSIVALKRYHIELMRSNHNTLSCVKFIKRDRELYKNKWLESSLKIYREFAEIFDNKFGRVNRDFARENEIIETIKNYFYEYDKIKSVVITGANGFIGRNLAKYLASKKNIQVYALVRNADKKTSILNHKNIHIIKCDDYANENLYNILPYSPEAFFHMAWGGYIHMKERISRLKWLMLSCQ